MTGLEVKFAYLSCSVLECCERCGGRRWARPWSRCRTPPATLSSRGTSRGPTWGRSTENRTSDQINSPVASLFGAGAGAPRMTPIKEDDTDGAEMQKCCSNFLVIKREIDWFKTILSLATLLPGVKIAICHFYINEDEVWGHQNRRLKKIMTKTFPLAL